MGGVAVNWNEPHAQRFNTAMDDDFNTPEAVAALFDLANEVNKAASPQLAAQLKALGSTLGLLQRDPVEFLQGRPAKVALRGTSRTVERALGAKLTFAATGGAIAGGSAIVEFIPAGLSKSVDMYIQERIAAKQSKNYAEADRIRKELLTAGIVLEDSATGTTWRRA